MGATETGVRWLDVVVPVPYSMQDRDLRLDATWTFPEGDLGDIRKLEYYGLSRAGYMGGDWMMIGPTDLQSNEVEVSLPTVSSVHAIARAQGVEDPVLHVFVMFSGGEPTMTLHGRWNGTDLAYSLGDDRPLLLLGEPFQMTSEDPTLVSANLPVVNPDRLVALAFLAEGPAGIWLSPRYDRPDGSSQNMRADILAEFSDLGGTWRFTMMTAGKLSDPHETVVWGTLFDPARAQSQEC